MSSLLTKRGAQSVQSVEHSGERGAALLVVLLLVSVMSLAAISAGEAVSYAARRGANVAAHNQAVWYLHGAEELARLTLVRSHQLDEERTTLVQPWAAGQLRFDVDGGVIEGAITDASNCFNLNSLAQSGERGRGYSIDEAARASLLHLLRALDIDHGSAERLVNGAADWIDADAQARGRGAEDYDYAFSDPPYRTANGLFVEVDELRGVAGVSEGVFRTVRPYLCARVDTAPATLNVNTLRREDAPLLTMLFGGRLGRADARDIIRDRPVDGWTSAEEFWALEAVQIFAVDEAVRSRVAVRASHFELHARVRYYDAFVEAHTLFRQTPGGDVSIIRRRFGAQS